MEPPGTYLGRLSRRDLYTLVGALVIGATVSITCYPVLKLGFWGDDFGFLERVGRLSWQQYFAYYFDPRLIASQYRPLQGIQWALEYALWKGDPAGYHWVQMLTHLANALLLQLVIGRLSGSRRIGVVAALVYGTWAAAGDAVYYICVPDPQATFFYLLGIWFWIRHLERDDWRSLMATCACIALALSFKEVAVTMPIVLFLLDRFIVARTAPMRVWAKRNAAAFSILFLYVLVDWNALANRFSTPAGPHVNAVEHFIQFAEIAAFPWSTGWMAFLGIGAAIGLVVHGLIKRRYAMPVLAAAALLNLLPVIAAGGFGSYGSRYLYLPLISSAVAVGLLIEWMLRTFVGHRLPVSIARCAIGLAAIGLAWLVLVSGLTTAEAVENVGAMTRQQRVKFRPIFDAHPTVADDTLFFFVNPPIPVYYLSGMMYLRYGTSVTVAGTDHDLADAARGKSAYVFTFDDDGTLGEQKYIGPGILTTEPGPPIHFERGVSLQAVEPFSSTGREGGDIVLLLRWRLTSKVDKDYSLFAHLVDERSIVVAGYDAQPQRDGAPMSHWDVDTEATSIVVLPIEAGTRVGDRYRIELGLYDMATMQRLSVLDGNQVAVSDKVDVGTFSIVP